jgi:hypothetical protein
VIKDRVTKSGYDSNEQFCKEQANQIKAQDFKLGTPVLVCNICSKHNFSSKDLLHYYGPMVVISRMKKHSYHLGELDKSVAVRGFTGY